MEGAEYNESHSLHCETQDYFIRNFLLELSKGFNKMILILLHYDYGAVLIIHRYRLFFFFFFQHASVVVLYCTT